MRVAVITGASRGIGAAIARALSDAGTMTIINYCGSEERARDLAAEIESSGGHAQVLGGDASDFQAVELMLKQVIAEHGRIDVLVNNAGITRDGLLMGMSEADYDAVMDTNLKGCFNFCRHAVRCMIKQRSGSIINVSSVSGLRGNPGQVNYAASKAGVIGLTKALAREVAGRGIRVNAVAPGYIETEMTAVLSERTKEAIRAQIPMGSFGRTEDIAQAVAFLASEQARYITGQVLAVDGGMSC